MAQDHSREKKTENKNFSLSIGKKIKSRYQK